LGDDLDDDPEERTPLLPERLLDPDGRAALLPELLGGLLPEEVVGGL
jgi:hypothetical protein